MPRNQKRVLKRASFVFKKQNFCMLKNQIWNQHLGKFLQNPPLSNCRPIYNTLLLFSFTLQAYKLRSNDRSSLRISPSLSKCHKKEWAFSPSSFFVETKMWSFLIQPVEASLLNFETNFDGLKNLTTTKITKQIQSQTKLKIKPKKFKTQKPQTFKKLDQEFSKKTQTHTHSASNSTTRTSKP